MSEFDEEFRYIHLNSKHAERKNGKYTFSLNLPNCHSIALKSCNISNTGRNIYKLDNDNEDLEFYGWTHLDGGDSSDNPSHTLQFVEVNTGTGYSYAKMYSYSISQQGHFTSSDILSFLNTEINGSTNNIPQLGTGSNVSNGNKTVWAFTQNTDSKVISLNLSKTGTTTRYIIPVQSVNSLWTMLGYSPSQLNSGYGTELLGFTYFRINKYQLQLPIFPNYDTNTITGDNLILDQMSNDGVALKFSSSSVNFVAQSVPMIDNTSGFYITSEKLCGEDSYMNQTVSDVNRIVERPILKWIPNSSPKYYHLEYETNFMEFHKLHKTLSSFDISILNENSLLVNESVIPSWKIVLVLRMYKSDGGYSENDILKLKQNAYNKKMCPC